MATKTNTLQKSNEGVIKAFDKQDREVMLTVLLTPKAKRSEGWDSDEALQETRSRMGLLADAASTALEAWQKSAYDLSVPLLYSYEQYMSKHPDATQMDYVANVLEPAEYHKSNPSKTCWLLENSKPNGTVPQKLASRSKYYNLFVNLKRTADKQFAAFRERQRAFATSEAMSTITEELQSTGRIKDQKAREIIAEALHEKRVELPAVVAATVLDANHDKIKVDDKVTAELEDQVKKLDARIADLDATATSGLAKTKTKVSITSDGVTIEEREGTAKTGRGSKDPELVLAFARAKYALNHGLVPKYSGFGESGIVKFGGFGDKATGEALHHRVLEYFMEAIFTTLGRASMPHGAQFVDKLKEAYDLQPGTKVEHVPSGAKNVTPVTPTTLVK